jgi:hypothetical protein
MLQLVRQSAGVCLLTALTIVSAACAAAQMSPSPSPPPPSGAVSPAPPTGPGATNAPPTVSPQPGQTGEGPGTFEADVVFGAGAVNFPDPAVGLSALHSYRATLDQAFDGTNSGEPYSWSRNYVLLASDEPAARQLTVEKSGGLADPEPVVIVEMHGAHFESRGDIPCSATPSNGTTTSGGRIELAGLLTGVIGADDAGTEVIDGVATNHYTFDQNALGQGAGAQSAGEMSVAATGGFIVKYSVTTQGKADYFGEGIEGNLSMTYALMDINQPTTIRAPLDCPAGLVDAPPFGETADLIDVPGLLSFTTASSMADAIAFYQQQLPTLGWQPSADPVVIDEAAWLAFGRANEGLAVFITVGDGRTTVDVVLENK